VLRLVQKGRLLRVAVCARVVKLPDLVGKATGVVAVAGFVAGSGWGAGEESTQLRSQNCRRWVERGEKDLEDEGGPWRHEREREREGLCDDKSVTM